MKIRTFFRTNNQRIEMTDEATLPISNKLPDNWDDFFKNHFELPPKEFQFNIGKQRKNRTDSNFSTHNPIKLELQKK